MTTYRVGEMGATVFDAHGTVVHRLPPGTVVVEGTLDCRGSLAAQHADNLREQKRIHGYADKRLVPAENKHVLSDRERACESNRESNGPAS